MENTAVATNMTQDFKDTLAHKLTSYREHKDAVDELKAQEDALKAQILELMDSLNADTIEFAGITAHIAEYTRKDVDTKRMKEQDMALYEKYLTTTEAPRLTVRKVKKTK